MIQTLVFRERSGPGGVQQEREHLALVVGEVARTEDLLVRVHSECWTGEVLRSLKCDCREQLDVALRLMAEAGAGVLLYLRQEGRGIGLGNKIRAYALQEQGMDTVDANLALGYPMDMRDFAIAAEMLRALDVRAVALLTNNPSKIEGLEVNGIEVRRRVSMAVSVNPHNESYLQTKKARMGHSISLVATGRPTDPR